MTIDIADLRAKLAAAKFVKPWAWSTQRTAIDTAQIGSDGETYDRDSIVLTPEPADDDDDWVRLGINAALIVAAVNALPALLDRIEVDDRRWAERREYYHQREENIVRAEREAVCAYIFYNEGLSTLELYDNIRAGRHADKGSK